MEDKYNHPMYKLQSDYICGTGKHGTVLEMYQQLLNEYKSKANKRVWFVAENAETERVIDKNDSSNHDQIIMVINIVALIYITIFCILSYFALVLLGFVISIIFFVLDFVVLSGENEDEDAKIVFRVVYCLVGPILAVVAYGTDMGIIAWLWYALPLIIHTAIILSRRKIRLNSLDSSYRRDKMRVMQLNRIDAEIEDSTQKLKDLIPKLREEYKEELKKLEKTYDLQGKNLARGNVEFPECFWWEIDPRFIVEKMEYISVRDWNPLIFDFKWKRVISGIPKFGKEFNAEMEYSPISKNGAEIYKYNKNYVRSHNGRIVDIYLCVKEEGLETEMVSRKEYAYSDLKRKRMTSNWIAEAEKVQMAYSRGEISEQRYKDLMHEFELYSYDVAKEIDKKIDVTGEESALTTDTYFEWIGQLMLLNVDDGYQLIDFRCQKDKMYDCCADISQKFNIKKVCGDFAAWDAEFMALMHRIFNLDKVQTSSITGTVQDKNVVEKKKESSQVDRNSTTAIVLGAIALSAIVFSFLSIPGFIYAKRAKETEEGNLPQIAYIINIIGLVIFCLFALWMLMAVFK